MDSSDSVVRHIVTILDLSTTCQNLCLLKREGSHRSAVDPTERTPAFGLHMFRNLIWSQPRNIYIYTYIYIYIYTHLMFNLPIVYVVYRRSSLQHSGVPSCPWFPGVEENGPFWNRNDFTVLRLAMVLAHTQTGIFESIKSFTFDTLFHVFVLFNRPSFHMISSNFIKHMQLSVINCHKLPFWILLLSSEKRALPTTAWHPGVR